MSDLLVLGIGSPFGDDQLGWQVVRLLQQRNTLLPFIPKQLQLTWCDRPGLSLLELMKGWSTVFLIDAIKTGAPIGSIHRFKNEKIRSINTGLSTHGLGLAEAMHLGEVLNILPSCVLLYGLEIGEIHYEFDLSTPIEEAIEAVTIQIETDILERLG